MTKNSMTQEVANLISAVKPISIDGIEEALQKMDLKTKPQGSLGRIEDIAIQMCLIQKTLEPSAEFKGHLVFAGDHGVCEEGVSAFPTEVTPQMVLNFLADGAAINVMCKLNDISIAVVDSGVNFEFDNVPGLIKKKVAKGTKNFAKEQAMTESEASAAIIAGTEAYSELKKRMDGKMQVLGLGEMGIGNTTAASAIIAAATGISAKEVTGRGTGVDDVGLTRKASVIEAALNLHKPVKTDGFDILCKVGGLEIAGIVGAALAAAADGVAVILDGVISTSAGLIAYLMQPKIKDYLFSAHKSVEVGQKSALELIGIDPLFDLGMRLGEGTGAALAMNLVQCGCRIMTDMASFESAGVSNKE